MASGLPALEKECFFIAPIGSPGMPERNRSDGILEFIVGRAAEELDLQAIRADQIAEPGQITLQVVEHVLGAKAAVADLTGLNANVFYELAVRHTARLPTALIAEKGCSLPFDIAQMRTIFFEHNDLRSADQCRKDIVSQLREAITNGAVDSPIATSVDVQALQSGSAVERNIAELVTAVEGIARTQRMTVDLTEQLYSAIRTGDLSPGALRDLGVIFRDVESYAEESGDARLAALIEQLRMPVEYLSRRSARDTRRISRDRLEVMRSRDAHEAAKITRQTVEGAAAEQAVAAALVKAAEVVAGASEPPTGAPDAT